jgi:hypothetical protein
MHKRTSFSNPKGTRMASDKPAAKKKAAPRKATNAQVVTFLSGVQRTQISSEDRAAITTVIRLIS